MTQSLPMVSGASFRQVNVEQYNSLRLKDGRLACEVAPDELREIMLKLSVPGVTHTEGRYSLLGKLAAFIESITVINWPEPKA